MLASPPSGCDIGCGTGGKGGAAAAVVDADGYDITGAGGGGGGGNDIAAASLVPFIAIHCWAKAAQSTWLEGIVW